MATNSFAATYRSFSNSQLYEVLQNKNEYQPAAVEAAAAELQSRNLSATEMEMLAKEWDQSYQLQQQRQEKKKSIERKVKAYRDRVLSDIDPLAPATTNRSIRMISIGILLILLYSFIKEYEILVFALKDFYTTDLMVLLPYVIVPAGVLLFWNKKRGGWIILIIWLVFTVVSIIFSVIQALTSPDDSGLAELLFPESKRDIASDVIALLVYGGLLVYINTKPIKDAFKVSKDLQVYLILALLMLSSLFFVTL